MYIIKMKKNSRKTQLSQEEIENLKDLPKVKSVNK